MTPTHKRRLGLLVVCIVFGSMIVALVLFALNQNINLFYTPQQITKGEVPISKRIRLGGMVRNGTLKHHEKLRIEFTVTDFVEDVQVEYDGILPDLFREGQGVVALGKLTENLTFKADEILAKHDENYMPPEVASALKQSL